MLTRAQHARQRAAAACAGVTAKHLRYAPADKNLCCCGLVLLLPLLLQLHVAATP
jgi:hypothetical protein